jgi:hypothetical protein
MAGADQDRAFYRAAALGHAMELADDDREVGGQGGFAQETGGGQGALAAYADYQEF